MVPRFARRLRLNPGPDLSVVEDLSEGRSERRGIGSYTPVDPAGSRTTILHTELTLEPSVLTTDVGLNP
jgi:hypothetical protein